MTCASRLIECPHCAATGCRNENCLNQVLANRKCRKCGQVVKKAKPLGLVCKTELTRPLTATPHVSAGSARRQLQKAAIATPANSDRPALAETTIEDVLEPLAAAAAPAIAPQEGALAESAAMEPKAALPIVRDAVQTGVAVDASLSVSGPDNLPQVTQVGMVVDLARITPRPLGRARRFQSPSAETAAPAFEVPHKSVVQTEPAAAETDPVAPACEPPSQPSRWSWLGGAGLVVILLALGGYASLPAIRSTAHTSAEGLPSMFADARELTVRYKGDRTAADKLFKGRRITLSGQIDRIGEQHIAVAASVHCTFPRRTTAEERAIVPGTTVVLRGAVVGSPAKGRVELNGCELLPPGD